MFERENTKGKEENLDRKRIEERIVSILCNFEFFLLLTFLKSFDSCDHFFLELSTAQ